MNKYLLKNENTWKPQLRNTIIFGFLLRLTMLCVILYALGDIWDIYYLEDDKSFEELAGKYLYNARGLIDVELMRDFTKGWQSPFWAYVLCISAKLFSYAAAPRYINIVLSTVCIGIVYHLCYEVSENHKTALTAARLFAYLPFSILVPCFPIKDIFIMVSVMYAFYLFVRIQKDRKVSILQLVLCSAALIGVFFTRGGVTELLLIFLMIYYFQKLYRKKRHLAALFFLFGAVFVLIAFRSTIFAAFEEKVDTYSSYGAEDASGLNAIRVTGVMDFYKLPLAYAFAMLQPLKMELFTMAADTRPWRMVMAYTNMTMYPVVIGAWLYTFVKKHNLFFWLSSFVMFCAVIILSLGVSRHYLFLFPIHLINYSLYTEETNENFKNRRSLIILGTFALFVVVFCYSLVKLLYTAGG